VGLASSGSSHAFASQLDAMGIVNEAVHNRIGVGRIADGFMPAVYWELRSDHCGTASITFLEDF